MKSRAIRCLFGRPTPEQQARTRAFLDAANERYRQEQIEKWGFDFDLGTPVPSTSGYVYEVLPQKEVPEFYRPKLLTVDISSPSSLDLSSTTLTPLSSPSTSDNTESLLAADSSFENEDEPKDWKFTEPSTSRKSPTKRQMEKKMTAFMHVSRKKSSLSSIKSASPSPKSSFSVKSRRSSTTSNPY
ncbi:unnamed protein product [Caenorhabditis sp. 36 PRJEB53466]|nr:unnamed protein product [Caenorhabditis sp. 36 PRJEB53466]